MQPPIANLLQEANAIIAQLDLERNSWQLILNEAFSLYNILSFNQHLYPVYFGSVRNDINRTHELLVALSNASTTLKYAYNQASDLHTRDKDTTIWLSDAIETGRVRLSRAHNAPEAGWQLFYRLDFIPPTRALNHCHPHQTIGSLKAIIMLRSNLNETEYFVGLRRGNLKLSDDKTLLQAGLERNAILNVWIKRKYAVERDCPICNPVGMAESSSEEEEGEE